MSQINQPGKPIFKQLTDKNITQIEQFCIECEKLGYQNNKSLTAMKFNDAIFFGAFDGNKLFSLAGVHKLPEVNEHAYRCLFRGAQLPGYTPRWSMDIFKSGIQFSQFIYLQIKYVQQFDNFAEFYITTNINNPEAGASSRLHNTMMPRLEKKGYWNLINPNITLFNTEQSLWKINIMKYMEDREIWLADEKNTD